MIAHVIGCGASGSLWDGSGYSIGVNDCEKFGRAVRALIVVNIGFTHERHKWIDDAECPDGFWSHMDYWAYHRNYHPLQFRQFHRTIEPGIIYHSVSTPFIAMSMAHYQGYKEIVLWGVDFTNHPIVNDSLLEREISTYLRFIEALRGQGTKVYLGSRNGVFKDLIPIWK